MKIVGVVLAAGRGTRLGPFSSGQPKPLATVLGEPLLALAVRHLADAGAATVYVNAWHHAEVLEKYVESEDWPVRVVVRREARLTGPAGALATFATELLEADVTLVSSGDIAIDGDLNGLVHHHLGVDAQLTFGTVDRDHASMYGILRLVGNRVVATEEKPTVPDDKIFQISAGVYALSRAAIEVIVDELKRGDQLDYAAHLAPALIASGRRVTAWGLPGYWSDVGTPAALHSANLDAAVGALHVGSVNVVDGVFVHETAEVASSVLLRAPCVIGPDAKIGARALLERCVLLRGATVEANSVLYGALLGPRRESS